MAAQMVVLRRSRAASKTHARPLDARLHVEPSWFPYTMEAADAALVRNVVRLQAAFRGHRARKLAQRVFNSTVMVSASAFYSVSTELKQIVLGWTHLAGHLALLVLVSLTAWTQLLRGEPSNYSMLSGLVSAAESVEAPFGGFADVRTPEDAGEFTKALFEALYAADPSFTKTQECRFESCTQVLAAANILSECGIVSPRSGMLDQHNRQVYGVVLTQSRKKLAPCGPEAIDVYSGVTGLKIAGDANVRMCISDTPASEFESDSFGVTNGNTSLVPDTVFKSIPLEDGSLFAGVFDLGVLNLGIEVSRCTLIELFDEIKWLDRRTSSYCLSLAVTNRNGIGRLGLFDLCWDFSLGGNVEASLRVQSAQKLDPHKNVVPLVLTAVHLAVSFTQIVVFARRQRRMKGPKFGRRRNMAHLVTETAVLLLHVVVACLYLLLVAESQMLDPFREFSAEAILRGISQLEMLIEKRRSVVYVYTVLLTLMVGRTIHFLDFHPDTAIVSKTLWGASKDLITFALVYGCILLSYAFIGILLHSGTGTAFSTLGHAISTLLMTTMSDFGDISAVFSAPTGVNVFINNLYVWSFIFLTTLILLNILLSIVVDAFVTFQTAKRRRQSIPFFESLMVTFCVLFYDLQWWHWPRFRRRVAHLLCCRACWSGPRSDSQSPRRQSQFIVEDTAASGKVLPALFSFFDPEKEDDATLRDEHTFLQLIKHMRRNCLSSVPTFVVRGKLEKVFTSRLVERLLALCRERTADLRPMQSRGELGILFHEEETQLYLIDMVRQVLIRTEKLEQLVTHSCPRGGRSTSTPAQAAAQPPAPALAVSDDSADGAGGNLEECKAAGSPEHAAQGLGEAAPEAAGDRISKQRTLLCFVGGAPPKRGGAP